MRINYSVFLGLFVVLGLVACGASDRSDDEDSGKIIGDSQHVIAVPEMIHLLAADSSNFRAELVVGETVYLMTLSDDGATVSYVFEAGLQKRVHTFTVNFYHKQENLLVASISEEYDFTFGIALVVFSAGDYSYDDVDNDGVSTLQEIEEGRNPLVNENDAVVGGIFIAAAKVLAPDSLPVGAVIKTVIEFDDEIIEMIYNTQNDQFEITLSDLKRRAYSFSVSHYLLTENGDEFLLVSGSREVDFSRETEGPMFTEEDYSYEDHDGDARPSVFELNEGGNPFYDEGNTPVIAAGEDVWVLSGDIVNLAAIVVDPGVANSIFWEALNGVS
ncbi:MAG: hypothetical protein JKY67_04545, partial [Pseudomonadales bacterium]|nr:hypothetical protein [Pseudomonadales bacterium]